jgi:hypothetical protein
MNEPPCFFEHEQRGGSLAGCWTPSGTIRPTRSKRRCFSAAVQRATPENLLQIDCLGKLSMHDQISPFLLEGHSSAAVHSPGRLPGHKPQRQHRSVIAASGCPDPPTPSGDCGATAPDVETFFVSEISRRFQELLCSGRIALFASAKN